jgi:hypothetical protein
MSDRLGKILEAGEDNRQADIELGRQLERERITTMLVVDGWEREDSPMIRAIKGEN